MSSITSSAGDCSSFIRISAFRARLRGICRRWTVVTKITQFTVRAIAVRPNLRKQFRVTINYKEMRQAMILKAYSNNLY